MKCVDASKLPEGNFDKTLLAMLDGCLVIARLPNRTEALRTIPLVLSCNHGLRAEALGLHGSKTLILLLYLGRRSPPDLGAKVACPI